ncbi:uncharacterized protein LOC131621383 [Vicia villosa]|uniref:uncharacterized protein LOC131621383 n=1 Tax=Vicia villosa TaxID=3911 RepID=UPI00273A84A3|nr:uncharacterized protein LOC131621383 [Vicia villosa]
MNTFCMVHPDNVSKELVSINDISTNVQGVVVKAVNVNSDFNNKQEFDDRDSMLTWSRRNATKLDFGVEIRGYRSEMQQVLQLLDDNGSVSWYRTCDDGVTIRDIFLTYPDLIKLFNTFLMVLILDSTNKTNKYRLPLFDMVGVTSTEKTYAVGFAFLSVKKRKILHGH